jgi:signal transduction histidine kinase
MAVPVFAGDDVSLVLYVAHTDVADIFGETEQRLASFVAEIAGAALENAQNMRQLAELNERLEAKVDERTQKLEERANELARSNAELERALSLQESILDATADGILVTNTAGEFVAYNERFQEMWEIHDEVAKRGNVEEAIAHVIDAVQDPEAFRQRVEAIMENDDEETFDVIEFEDGRIFERYSRPQRIEAEAVGRVWSFRDVTENRRVRRSLEQANEDLRQFAYAASHDLQEPIRMVASYAQLLESRYADDLDEEAREYIEYAVDGAQRMRQLIKGLLKYSRVDKGGSEPEPVDLEELVDDVCRDLEVKIAETDATIETGDLPEIEADRSQLGQVFQNLLNNAIKFRREDVPPQVRVTAQREGRCWRVSVGDNGKGLDPDRADRLFQIFQRGQAREDHEGEGIGLAICKKIVDRHGGDIEVESTPGEGTTFHLLLPQTPVGPHHHDGE